MAWPDRFREIAHALREAVGDVALRIDHIGSTAVPGLAAKPVVDLQISVAALEPTEPYRAPLEALGYRFRPENPDRAKRYFRERPATPRTHVHVRRHGSFGEQLALLFRDFLREHPAHAERYASHKRELAGRFRNDRSAYVEAKGPSIWKIVMLADAWAQESGWEPGPSDA